MEIEYEATFPEIDKPEIRKKLKKIGAKLVKPEFMQKRVVFSLPKGNEIRGGWLRVRDEGDKITMSLKVVDGDKIENQKESCLKVDDFDNSVLFLESIGATKKAFQESKRELWIMDNVDITIDEWPFLEPYLEIEGSSEKEVKDISQRLGLDYKKALFCSVDILYEKKYGVSRDIINSIPEIRFNSKNPFIK